MASFNKPNSRQSKSLGLRQVLISVLFSYIVDLALFVVGSASGARNIYSDWTLYWAWAISSIIVVVFILHSFRIDFKRLLLIIVIVSIFSGAVWYPLLNSHKIGINNFYGIEYLASSRAHRDVRIRRTKEFSFIYKHDNPEFIKTVEELKTKNQLISIKGFMFWQTGIAYGFGQRYLPKFYESRGQRFYHIALAFTVGPVVILESLINGAIRTAALFLFIQIGWYSIRKKPLLTRP